jgi:hypothetical protein
MRLWKFFSIRLVRKGQVSAAFHYAYDRASDYCYSITMQSAMNRRLARLEAQRRKRVPGPMIEFSCLSPDMQALWLGVGGDLDKMNLVELDLLQADLRRLTV